MDGDKNSARLLKIIADHLDIPIEEFMKPIADPANASEFDLVLNHRDAPTQARHLLMLYCSLPDQSSRDLAVKMVERFAKNHGKH